MLFGHPPQYSTDLALVPLGLVEELHTKTGRKYLITQAGLRKARSVMASRRHLHARANRERKDDPLL